MQMFLILTYPSFSINILDLIISWGEGNVVDGYQTVAWPAGSVEDGVVVFMLGGHSIQILYLLKRNVFLEIYFRQLLDFLNREKLNIESTSPRINRKIRVN